jgi:hypothetical protein
MKENKLGNSFRHAYDIGQLDRVGRSGIITAKDDKDIYRFKVTSRSRINFSMDNWDLDIQLLKRNRSEPPNINSTRSLPPQYFGTIEPGTYYFKVSGKGIKEDQTYSFGASASADPSDEPSNGFRPRLPIINLRSTSLVGSSKVPIKSGKELFQ